VVGVVVGVVEVVVVVEDAFCPLLRIS